MAELHLRTEDHPSANGRQPLPYEQATWIKFPLEDGSELVLHMGNKTADQLMRTVLAEAMDEHFQRQGQPGPLFTDTDAAFGGR